MHVRHMPLRLPAHDPASWPLKSRQLLAHERDLGQLIHLSPVRLPQALCACEGATTRGRRRWRRALPSGAQARVVVGSPHQALWAIQPPFVGDPGTLDRPRH